MKVWEEDKSFQTELLADVDVMSVLSEADVHKQFDSDYHTKYVDTIFHRVFGSG